MIFEWRVGHEAAVPNLVDALSRSSGTHLASERILSAEALAERLAALRERQSRSHSLRSGPIWSAGRDSPEHEPYGRAAER